MEGEAATFYRREDPANVEKDYFDYFYREYDEFIFPVTVYPDVSRRPHTLLMH